MKRVAGAVAGLLSLGSWWAFYVRYFQWRDCFNELGRCYDPDGSHEVYTTAGMSWALPAVVLLIIAVWLLWRRTSADPWPQNLNRR